jgi:selenocysteine-specific elongation factor
MPGELKVVATAGHVDHGKSSLILRLTGIDPDRWAEEKRRGLTIDLGYAWTTLPSGREIAFVDVPGHERFIGNMLAGVGPVRLVLFVVAADEGWKPQSEEHLQILDVLGVRDGVVALTKRDLVDDEVLALAESEVHDRLSGTGLAGAPIIAVSSTTGEGFDGLSAALEAMLDSAGGPEESRTRLFVDRVFTMKGAGTVVTGTLGGNCLRVGDEVELYPGGTRARIRSLQTHERAVEQACPVSRVAANLVGIEREELSRGVVLGAPGAWRATKLFETHLRPVRGLSHAITARGAFKLYAGAAETDARIRLYGTTSLEPGDEAFGRIRTSHPLVLDVGDRFVIREAGRIETVAGGVVLDVAPPTKAGTDAIGRLTSRRSASRDELPGLLVAERGAIPRAEAVILTGSRADGGVRIGEWLMTDEVRVAVEAAVTSALAGHHSEHPLEPGAELDQVRRVVLRTLRETGAPVDADLSDTMIADLCDRGVAVREGATIRLTTHRVALGERSEDVERLLAAIGGDRERTPPTIGELVAEGIGRDVIDAAARADVVVRLTPDLVVSREVIAYAEAAIRAAGEDGITVSALRETLGTTRKYAVPIMEWFDQHGVTRREGDLRFLRRPNR